VTNTDKSPGEGLSMTTTEDGRTVSLMDIISSNPEGFLGDKHYSRYGNQIGVLARVGDTNIRLVIQAHPDKENALKYLNYAYGKSEAWCILNCRDIGEETPHVYAGFKNGVTRDIWEKLFEKQNVQGMLDAMHKIRVKRGDVIFIKASMPHTIGPGVLFLELHEPSDYILRLEKKYLNIRTFPDDELHCGIGYERLFDCFDYTTYTEKELLDQIMVFPKLVKEGAGFKEFKLLSHEQTNCFAISKILIKEKYILNNEPRHCIVVVVNGRGWILGSRNKKEVRRGQGIFVPAGLKNMTFESNTEGLEIVVGYPPVISN
jgi:mannose-6-phosphate isomerase